MIVRHIDKGLRTRGNLIVSHEFETVWENVRNLEPQSKRTKPITRYTAFVFHLTFGSVNIGNKLLLLSGFVPFESLRMEDSGAMGWRVGRKVAEEDRKRLEWASGVWIHEESLTLCCSIVQRFFDGSYIFLRLFVFFTYNFCMFGFAPGGVN